MEIQLDKLTKQYGSGTAVDGVSIVLKPGVYGLLGANGAGKTTLMRMICGVLTPSSGEIRADGKPISRLGEKYYERLGYMPQYFGFYPDFSAREFLLYMAAVKGLDKKRAGNRADELLSTVNLTKMAGKKIRSFSGGMKQRLGIAQAELNDPELLILDEPTAGLDPKERVRFRNLISDLARNKTVILSTHIVSDISYIADTILLMKNGRFILTGSVDEVTGSINGMVWETVTDEQTAKGLMSRFPVVNLHHEYGLVRLRIVSSNKPHADAVQVKAGLEDLFLYHFGEEGKEENT
jgi:ABC-2 type transport system ATP-binding protein